MSNKINKNSRHGKLFIVAAPSGGGKTSLVSALVQRIDRLQVSISYTTRPPRADERDGVNYYFIDEASYYEMLGSDAFLEHASVFGHHYATGKEWVVEKLAQGYDVILEIDWQGAQQIRRLFPAVSIFILPPSLSVLRERLQKRGQDDALVIQQRMDQSRSEMVHYTEFDYLVINHEFEKALQDLCHIISAERLRRDAQQREQAEFLGALL